MTSAVNIANQALLMLGENAIQSLDEQTTEAQLANAFYADTRNYVLADLKPPFARLRVALSDALQPPAIGTTPNRYALPVDCLVAVSAGTLDRSYTNWVVEGREILAQQPLQWITYVSSEGDLESVMDPMFVKALVAYLAHDLSFGVTGDRTEKTDYLQIYALRAGEARNLYGQQGSTQVTSSDELQVGR